MNANSRMDRFFRQMDAEQNRHYARLDEYGFWGAGMKDLFYGILSKQSKSEKDWKRNVEQELKSISLYFTQIAGRSELGSGPLFLFMSGDQYEYWKCHHSGNF